MGDEVQRSLGKIEGSLDIISNTVTSTAIDVQEIKVSQAETAQTVEVHVTKISKAEDAIDSLKASRNKLTGIAIGFGALGAGLAKAGAWIISKSGGL